MFRKKSAGAKNIRRRPPPGDDGQEEEESLSIRPAFVAKKDSADGRDDQDEDRPVTAPSPQLVARPTRKPKNAGSRSRVLGTFASVHPPPQRNVPSMVPRTDADDQPSAGGTFHAYTDEALRQLMMENEMARLRTTSSTVVVKDIVAETSSADLDMKARIELARKKRELARFRQQVDSGLSAGGNADRQHDFLPLHASDDGARRRPRMPAAQDSDEDMMLATTERGDDDDDELVELGEDLELEHEVFAQDYGSNRLAFGHEAVRRLHEKQRREMQAALKRNLVAPPPPDVEQQDHFGDDGMALDDDEHLAQRGAQEEVEEEDEEMLEWEQQQIRKGGHSGQEITEYLEEKKRLQRGMLPPQRALPTFQEALRKYKAQLEQRKTLHQQDVKNLHLLQQEEQNLVAHLERIRQEMDAHSAKYDFFEDLRGWSVEFASWLEDKMPQVDALVSQWVRHWQSRTQEESRIRLQRMQDSVDALVYARTNRKLQRVVPMSEDGAEGQQRFEQDEEELNDTVMIPLQRLFDDTQTEYRDFPSVLARFLEWKQRFSEDYIQAYVPLALPGVIEIFIKRECVLEWRPLVGKPPRELNTLPWCATFMESMHRSSTEADVIPTKEEEDASMEVLALAMEKYTLPLLHRMLFSVDERSDSEVEQLPHLHHSTAHTPATLHHSAFDPFSTEHVDNLMTALEDLHVYLDAQRMAEGGFSGILEDVLKRFQAVIKELLDSIDLPRTQDSTSVDGTATMIDNSAHIGAIHRDCLQPTLQLLQNILGYQKRMGYLYTGLTNSKKPADVPGWFHDLVGTRRIVGEFLVPLVEELRVVGIPVEGSEAGILLNGFVDELVACLERDSAASGWFQERQRLGSLVGKLAGQ